MRILELIFLICVLIGIVSFFIKRSSLIKYSLYVCTLLLILHLSIEQGRWQMFPGYFSFSLLILLYVFQKLNVWIRKLVLVFGLLFSVLSLVLANVLPVFQLPSPSGKYRVGEQTIFLEDHSRIEKLSEEQGAYRKLTIHIWYPSTHKITKPEVHMGKGYAEAFVQSKGMPSFIGSHFELIETHTQKLLPIIENKQFPVVLLSHGLLWNSKMYTSIVEEIVSNGYIVVGIDHIYESFMTEYKGKKLRWSQKNIDDMNVGLDFGYINERMNLGLQKENTASKSKAVLELNRYLPYFESLDRWSDDISFVLDQIEALNRNRESVFFKKFDLNKIGSLGHSWGGAAVVQNASVENRVKAVVNMDGAQWGRVVDTTIQKPLLVLHADRNYDTFFTPNFFVYDKITEEDYYLATIKYTGHANFGDLSYWSKIHSLTETGTIDPTRMSFITNSLIINFFDKYFDHRNSASQDHFFTTNLPEVHIVKKK
ncbi:hypothetical protein M0D21_20850 [Aquimarina sp. D1M17]|uniref:alpha/beta hydrolase family protein n=1 Tax=Aquimarina acroporae TaxID=2937283 RepID=UPI0020BE2821|nr:hypothetical protein [Aquimarina acroporae]MCK8524039.1 hypothetical protein [Aquimarina acroporae]